MPTQGKDERRAIGGRARAAALSDEQKAAIARKAADARWNSELPKATHEGSMHIGGVEIPCAVLEDGRRLITQSGFMRALGRARQAKGREHYEGDVNLPAFLTAKNLKPYISKELEVSSSQLEFKPLKGARAFGYPAELLPNVCGVFLDADDAGVLTAMQKHVAARARILIRGLAHVGVTALVDEATGYQEVRDRRALQAILDQYLKKELAAWAKRFPDDFYREMFRLKGWPMNPAQVKRPGVVGKYTNNIVYERLAPGILEELEKRNPKDEKGNRKGKHHQLLTEEVGHPALAQHLYAVIGAMRAHADWDEFLRFLNRAYPKKNSNLELDLEVRD
ncbi:MAG: P63C domain-containing protein [Pseudomonadota bacterium]